MDKNKLLFLSLNKLDKPNNPLADPVLNKLAGNGKWVNFGCDNLMPQNLIELFITSPVHNAIVLKKAEYTAGKDIICTNPAAQIFAETIDNGAGLYQLFFKMALDYYIHGGFSLQVLWNDLIGKVGNFVYQDWSTIRRGFATHKNEMGEHEQGVWISADWAYNPFGGNYKFKPCYYPFFHPDKPCSLPTFYTYYRYTPGFSWYPLPDWYACVNSILTETKLIRFKDATISNAFSPGGTLVLPGIKSEEGILEFQKILETEYKGMENAGKTMVVFSDDERKAEYLPFNSNSPEKDVTSYLQQAREDIIIAHRLPSPTLIGLPGGASLGGDGGTIEAASKEFFNKVILVPQQIIKQELIKMFKHCGYETDIIITQNIPGFEQI